MEDGGMAYKGWVAREGRGSGTCRRVARRLVCCFFDAVPSDATTSFIYFQISEIQVQTSPFCFLKWLRHLQKIHNQQRHDLCFANNARETLGRPSAQIPRGHLNTPISSSLSLPSNKSFQPLSHYFTLTPTNTQTLIHNVFWWQRQGFL